MLVHLFSSQEALIHTQQCTYAAWHRDFQLLHFIRQQRAWVCMRDLWMEIGTNLFLQSFLQHLLLETDHMLSGQSALLDGNHRNGRERELKRELTHDGGTEPVGAQHPQPSVCTTTQLSGLLVTEHFSLSTFLQEPIGEVSQTPPGHSKPNHVHKPQTLLPSPWDVQRSVQLYREAQYCSLTKRDFTHRFGANSHKHFHVSHSWFTSAGWHSTSSYSVYKIPPL